MACALLGAVRLAAVGAIDALDRFFTVDPAFVARRMVASFASFGVFAALTGLAGFAAWVALSAFLVFVMICLAGRTEARVTVCVTCAGFSGFTARIAFATDAGRGATCGASFVVRAVVFLTDGLTFPVDVAGCVVGVFFGALRPTAFSGACVAVRATLGDRFAVNRFGSPGVSALGVADRFAAAVVC